MKTAIYILLLNSILIVGSNAQIGALTSAAVSANRIRPIGNLTEAINILAIPSKHDEQKIIAKKIVLENLQRADIDTLNLILDHLEKLTFAPQVLNQAGLKVYAKSTQYFLFYGLMVPINTIDYFLMADTRGKFKSFKIYNNDSIEIIKDYFDYILGDKRWSIIDLMEVFVNVHRISNEQYHAISNERVWSRFNKIAKRKFTQLAINTDFYDLPRFMRMDAKYSEKYVWEFSKRVNTLISLGNSCSNAVALLP